MIKRAVLNVATGGFVAGQKRLKATMARRSPEATVLAWQNKFPDGSPTHRAVPYAFKAYAIMEALGQGFTSILWADASIVPVQDMEPMWQLIEQQGYWFSRNGFRNSEWTSREALPLLGVTDEENRGIQHVVGGAFGLDLNSELGRRFADEYMRLAQNGAFCGPWDGGVGIQHRHDQTAASVIAWKLGMRLTDPPAWFAYLGGQTADTFLIADANY